MKKLLFLSTLLLALAGPTQAQTAPVSIVVVRIYEDIDHIRTVTIRSDGKSETLDFVNGRKDEGLQRSAMGYYQLVSSLYREGYVLQSTITPSGVPISNANGAQFGGFATLVFVKKS